MSTTTTATVTKVCAHHDCTDTAEHAVYNVPLCMVHWLRDRVRLNIARCTDVA